mgnify:CR=1 FL=1
MKKAWAAATAERLLEGKGWVPELMRTQPLQVAVAVEHPMGETEAVSYTHLTLPTSDLV